MKMPPTDTHRAPDWRHVGVFLALTFGLTWLIDLGVFLHGGINIADSTTALQLQMLIPAFSAILLGTFFFPESPLFYARPTGPGRWFYRYFLAFSVIFALGVLGMWLVPTQEIITLVAIVAQLAALIGLLVLVALRLANGSEAMTQVGLTWGKFRYYLLFGLGFIGFYVLQVLLNAPLGLGPVQAAPIPAPPGLSPTLALILGGVGSVLLTPILAIVIAFGEEYGWRGYLQGELFKLGRVRGVLLVGVIWGVWHWPLILMGWSYPGYPWLGLLLTALFTTGLAVALGYAVLKSGSILLAAYLHALNDQVTGLIVALGFKPFDPVFSFGVGIYGIVTLAIVALLILRDPIWRNPTGG